MTELPRVVTAEGMRVILRRAIAETGSMRKWADAHGVGKTMTGEVRLNRRRFSDKVAEALGYERIILWKRKDVTLESLRALRRRREGK